MSAGRAAIEAELAAVGAAPEQRIDIARTALALAALDHPEADRASYAAHLDQLARDVAALSPQGWEQAAAALAQALAATHRYRGDDATYDDMQNADLMRVIDRRKGLPVALGILYLHAGRAQGWRMVGLAFPGHFLIRLELDDGRAILDPFARGRILGSGELRALAERVAGRDGLDPRFTDAASDREVLLRLLNNIKSRALQAQDAGRAAEILHRMTLIAPGQSSLWGELGLIEAARGNLGRAIQLLQRWRELAPSEEERQRAAAALQQARKRLN